MIGDARFRMPSIEGVDLSDETQLKEYFGSLGNAIAKTLQQLTMKMNDPSLILVGTRPLDQVMAETGWQSGDLKCTTASRAVALRQQGWVFCDGRNGTAASIGAVPLGAPDSTNPNVIVPGTNPITTGGPLDGAGNPKANTDIESQLPETVIEAEDDACKEWVAVAVADHTHPFDHFHEVDILAYMATFTVIWMMKL